MATTLLQRRPRLSEEVFAALAIDIIRGDLSGAVMLPTEAQLCARFNVSRTVIREAMIRLQRHGLVAVRQGVGTVILPRSQWNDLDPDLLRIRAEAGLIDDLVDDLLTIRRIVEVEVAAVAALTWTEADREALLGLMIDMDAARDQGERFNDLDVLFHEALITASGNRLLHQMMRPVNQIRRIGSLLTTRWDIHVTDAAMVHHRAIMDAVLLRDADAARKAMRRHVDDYEKLVRAALPQDHDGLTAADRIAVLPPDGRVDQRR